MIKRLSALRPKMTSGDRRVAPWLVGGSGLLLAGVTVVLHVANSDTRVPDLILYGPNLALECASLTVLGALILRRHRHQPIGMLLAMLGLAAGISGLAGEYVAVGAGGHLLPGASWAAWLASFLWYPPYALLPTLLLVLIPDGRPPSRHWWPVAVAAVAFVALDTVWFALTPLDPARPAELAGLSHPLGLTGEPRRLEDLFTAWPLVALVILVACVAALITRLVRASPLGRRQLGWFALGCLLWLAFVVVDATSHLSDTQPMLEAVFLLLPPLGATVGIVRHDLLDVRRIVHRGLVAVAFAVGAGGIYAATVLVAEQVVGPKRDLGTSAVAVGAVAAGALPLWRALNRLVERLLYGARAEPFEVLARLGAELDVARAPQVVLGRVASSLAQSLRLPFVALEVEGQQAAVCGSRRPQATAWPLVHNGIRVGTLLLGHRSDTESFAKQERRLVEDLSRRLAATVHALRLATDLQGSRERLVLAREEERRRVRHDLHDGLGPQLAGVGLQLDLARELLTADPDKVGVLLARAKDELSAAIVDVRRVVDGLRPPALDELGLVEAIRQQVSLLDSSLTGGLHISVDAPEQLGDLPAAVEVAAFRIATEATTNAARHAHARRCTISLRRREDLEVEVHDDGQGIDDPNRSGVGLVSLRDRAEELGGRMTVDSTPGRGTRIRATLPLP